jgi:hypothetical protein
MVAEVGERRPSFRRRIGEDPAAKQAVAAGREFNSNAKVPAPAFRRGP